MSHTKGKLTWGMLYISQPENHGKYKQIAMHPSGLTQAEGSQWEHDARRLVACWNEHDELVAKCDELLEALRESLIIGSAYFNASHQSLEHPVLRDAAAILAKHQKGTDHAK